MFETLFRKFILTQKQDRGSPRQPILWIGLALLIIFAVACSSPAEGVTETAVPPTSIPPTNVPPTDVPATAVPAIDVPPTEVAVSSEALVDAIKADDVVAVQRLLEAGVDPNLDNKGAYPLIVAVSRGNAEIVKLLIEHGSDVTIKMPTGETLIDFATSRQQFQVVEFLDEQILEQYGFVTGEITSPALAGNLLGDPTTREYFVYLPPSYATGNQHYPVLYALHNWNHNNHEEAMAMINTGLFEGDGVEMIIVFPDASNAFRGSTYGSSPTMGDYETYIVHDLVNHIDANFRTLPQPDSRGITGWGIGGWGAMRFALKHPDIFGVVAGLTLTADVATIPHWEWGREQFHGNLTDFNEFAKLQGRERYPLLIMSFAAEAASNSEKPPFYIDMPYEMVDGEAQIVPEVAEKINNTLNLPLPQYLAQPIKLNAILIYHGTLDDQLPVEHGRAWSQLLSEQGIDHEYYELADGKTRLPYNPVIEFMFEHLSFEMSE